MGGILGSKIPYFNYRHLVCSLVLCSHHNLIHHLKAQWLLVFNPFPLLCPNLYLTLFQVLQLCIVNPFPQSCPDLLMRTVFPSLTLNYLTLFPAVLWCSWRGTYRVTSTRTLIGSSLSSWLCCTSVITMWKCWSRRSRASPTSSSFSGVSWSRTFSGCTRECFVCVN